MSTGNTFNNILRCHCVSVRLNDEELSLLNQKRGRHRKGEWLRMAFLHNLPSVIKELVRENTLPIIPKRFSLMLMPKKRMQPKQ